MFSKMHRSLARVRHRKLGVIVLASLVASTAHNRMCVYAYTCTLLVYASQPHGNVTWQAHLKFKGHPAYQSCVYYEYIHTDSTDVLGLQY